MRPLLLWVAVPLMLLGAGMLIAGMGSTALWIAVVTLGIALMVVGRARRGGTTVMALRRRHRVGRAGSREEPTTRTSLDGWSVPAGASP